MDGNDGDRVAIRHLAEDADEELERTAIREAPSVGVTKKSGGSVPDSTCMSPHRRSRSILSKNSLSSFLEATGGSIRIRSAESRVSASSGDAARGLVVRKQDEVRPLALET